MRYEARLHDVLYSQWFNVTIKSKGPVPVWSPKLSISKCNQYLDWTPGTVIVPLNAKLLSGACNSSQRIQTLVYKRGTLGIFAHM